MAPSISLTLVRGSRHGVGVRMALQRHVALPVRPTPRSPMSSSPRRRWTLVIPAAAAALLVTAVPFATSAEVATPPPAQGTRTFCHNVAHDTPFTDVGPGAHHDNILCPAAARITEGTSPTPYTPAAAVRRDQLEGFIAR